MEADEAGLAELGQAIDEGLAKALREIDAQYGLAGVLPAPGEADAEVEAEVMRLFTGYLEANALMPAEGGDLKVDGAFLQRHGGPLLMHMLQGIAAAIVRDEPAGGAEVARPPGAPVKVDLSELLGDLFAPPEPGAEG